MAASVAAAPIAGIGQACPPSVAAAFSVHDRLDQGRFDIHLSAQVELRPGVFKPIARACEQEQNPDGSIAVQVKAHDDPTWRKGV